MLPAGLSTRASIAPVSGWRLPEAACAAAPPDGRRYRAKPANGRAADWAELLQAGDEFEGRAAGIGGQLLFGNSLREFKDEVVFRCQNPHRRQELLLYVF